jgi:transmembrane sensor
MTGREPAQNNNDEAAAWAARIDRGLDASEQRELDAWLADDPRREGALVRAESIWLHAERATSLGPLIAAPEPETIPPVGFKEHFPPALLSRRAALFGGGALAAGLVGAVALPSLFHHRMFLRSGVGEIRRIPLDDGSVVTLDTDSLLEVAFTQVARIVRLRSGSAYFEVADALRPFLVETGELVLRAAASAFSVRAVPGLPLTLLVSRGHVEVQRSIAGPAIDVVSNMRATLAEGMQRVAALKVQPLPPEEIDRSLSWRNGMLSFEGETLGEAAATFRRYGLPAIEVPDAKLARKPITGVFTANDPAGFARAAAVSLDANAIGDAKVIRMTSARPT